MVGGEPAGAGGPHAPPGPGHEHDAVARPLAPLALPHLASLEPDRPAGRRSRIIVRPRRRPTRRDPPAADAGAEAAPWRCDHSGVPVASCRSWATERGSPGPTLLLEPSTRTA